MKNFADIKRKLVKGNSVVMLRHDWYPKTKLIGMERKIIVRQSNAVQFEGGSWLRLDYPANHFIPTGEDTFLVLLNENHFMEYKII